MPATTTARDDRIELRTSREEKRLLAAAAGVALAIDAKDEAAAGWYERFGALRLLDHRLALVPPLSTIATALTAADKRRR
jgi:hypothetical protein